MRNQKTFAVLFLLFLGGFSELFALESQVLDNGLEVFLEENHLVPLVNIRITLRAGAIVETPDLNGLCHLYEHMLFKGNALYRNQREFKAALKRLGVGRWNGGTSTEYVSYYITIPSEKVEEGLKFWAYAVKDPLLSPEELIKEIDVVHNEIAGKQSEPEYLLRQARLLALYPDYYFRRDTGGDLAIIDTATREKMEHIRNNFYVPNNAALFVAGDIDPDTVMDAVKTYYADWPRGPEFPELDPHKPLHKDIWVAVNNSPRKGLVSVSFTFRGPDTGIDSESTYGADVWAQMANDPQGQFKNNLYKAVPELHGATRHISAGYFTQRDAGTTTFSFTVTVPEEKGLWDIIKRLRAALVKETARMLQDNYFSPQALAAAKTELENHDILSRETAAGYMSNLSFWWASTSTEYYLNYLANIQKVTRADVQAYLQKYVHARYFLTSIWIHKDDDQKHGIMQEAEKANSQITTARGEVLNQ